MAACRLAAKGRSLADSSYDAEVRSILAFLQLQHPAPAPVINPQSLDINPEDYAAPRFVRKLKSKVSWLSPTNIPLYGFVLILLKTVSQLLLLYMQLVQRILEAHTNVKDLPLVEAKLNYIKAWQSLPEHGISLFIIKMMGHKKEELLGVASNRLMRMDLHTGDHIQTWRFNTIKVSLP